MTVIARNNVFDRGVDDLFKGMFLRPVRFDLDAPARAEAKWVAVIRQTPP